MVSHPTIKTAIFHPSSRRPQRGREANHSSTRFFFCPVFNNFHNFIHKRHLLVFYLASVKKVACHQYKPHSEDALQLCLHARQWEVFQCTARFRVLVAGRRFGKTELAVAEMVRAAYEDENRVVWYIGPSDRQSKRVIWRRLKQVTRPHWAAKPNEEECRVDLKCGSSITISGAFNPDTLRGDGLDFVVLDEVASMKPDAWDKVLRPALSDREGRALFISTPQGRNHLYNYFELAKTNSEWQSFQFTTEHGGLVKKRELDSAATDMDANSFRQEYDAEFTSIGKHRVYYAFERENNVRDDLRFDGTQDLIWSIDFNVNPMCMLLMQRCGDDVHVLEEIIIKPDANTQLACEAFLARTLGFTKQVPWTHQPMSVKIYGDASGHQRHTAGVATDWVLIKEFFRSWKGTFEPRFYHATQNPLIRDRVNCVNARLRNQHGDCRLFIDPSCKELIRDLEEVSWAVDSNNAPTRELDKQDRSRTHTSDALGYFISQIFPMRVPSN
jgi:hypothetical protein